MIVDFWGTRGSVPAFAPTAADFGGNTACVSIAEGNTLLILDAGSGIRRLGLTLESGTHRYIHILLTHLHFDHIQGLGFFQPLFDSSAEINIWGPPSATATLENRLKRYLSPPLFPLLMRDFPSTLFLHEVPLASFRIGPFDIQAQYVIHPGPTVGYRISNGRSTLAYLPDHEPFLGMNGKGRPDPEWISGYGLAERADMLIHDGQYTEAEYEARVGWGHCSIQNALEFARMAQVKHLMVFHHDPGRTDAQLRNFQQQYVVGKNLGFRVSFAREGSQIQV